MGIRGRKRRVENREFPRMVPPHYYYGAQYFMFSNEKNPCFSVSV